MTAIDIIENILKIKSENIKVEMILTLTNEFRSGRNPIELLESLEVNNKNIVRIALYVLGEVNISNDTVLQRIIARLFVLSSHEDFQVRYKTLINLASLSMYIDSDILIDTYIRMSKDEDENIRETACKLLESGHL